MEKLCLFVILAIISTEALSMSYRNKRQAQQSVTPTTTTGVNPTVFTVTPELRQCRLTCPTTAEYNPVCGTNMQTYDNPSRLFCDQACGVNVSQLRSSRCPATVN